MVIEGVLKMKLGADPPDEMRADHHGFPKLKLWHYGIDKEWTDGPMEPFNFLSFFIFVLFGN